MEDVRMHDNLTKACNSEIIYCNFYPVLTFVFVWQGGFVLDMGVHYIAGLRMVNFHVFLLKV